MKEDEHLMSTYHVADLRFSHYLWFHIYFLQVLGELCMISSILRRTRILRVREVKTM